MKKNMMLRMVVFFSIVLFTPCWLCAETAPDPIKLTVNNGIQANVPKNPDELLLVIQKLIANKFMDGHELCVKWLGIDKGIWVKSAHGTLESEYIGPFAKYPPAPFQFEEAVLDLQGNLAKLVLTFYRNPDFLMTPALVQKILGQPTIIWVGVPKNENSSGRYTIEYRYDSDRNIDTKDQYYINIKFINKDEKELYLRHSPEQMQSEALRRKSFEIHKGYLPLSLELHL